MTWELLNSMGPMAVAAGSGAMRAWRGPPPSPPMRTPTVPTPPSAPPVGVMGQSYTMYRNAELEVEYALAGKRDTPVVKGNRVEGVSYSRMQYQLLGVSTMIQANPQMNAAIVHLGGPSRPDFIPRTSDGTNYDFIHGVNYDTFPLNRAQIDAHMYNRPYSFTLQPWFYLNPPGGSANPNNVARLQRFAATRQ